jgi:hypothetical protein
MLLWGGFRDDYIRYPTPCVFLICSVIQLSIAVTHHGII